MKSINSQTLNMLAYRVLHIKNDRITKHFVQQIPF